MTTFTVWKFHDAEGATHAASVLKDAEADGLVKIVDHAVVSWPPGADKPETHHTHDDPKRGVPGRSVSRWGAVLDDIAGFDPEHRLLLETGYPTRFPTSERSHYARVIASSNECCSDTQSRGCEGGVAKTKEALTDALVAPIFSAPPVPTSRGTFLHGAASTGRIADKARGV